jgi:peptidoglycan/LPS O-acetylase OafA/YrhL
MMQTSSNDPGAVQRRHDVLGAMLGGRNNNLNLIRIVAASAVLFSHGFSITTGNDMREPFRAQTGLSLGQFSVAVFFAISGLLIARSFDRRENLAHFVAARFLRLWPGLLAVLCLSAFVLGPAITDLPRSVYWHAHDTWTFVPRNLSLYNRQHELPGVFTNAPYGPEMNSSLWSLFYEVACYVVVVVLGGLGLMRRGWVFSAFMAFVVVAHCWSATHHPTNGLLYRLQVMAFFGFPFALGMAAYVWRDNLPIKGWLTIAIWLVPAVLYNTAYEPTGLMIALAYTAFYCAFVPKGAVLLYNRLGDYSYGIYIYAFPTQQVFEKYFPHLSPIQHIACAAPVVLVLAVLSWHGLESHALTLARPIANHFRRLGRSQEPVNAA